MSRNSFRKMRVDPADIDLFAACFAQIAYQMDETIDEVEAFDMVRERLQKNTGALNYMDAVELGIMFKTTSYKHQRGAWN